MPIFRKVSARRLAFAAALSLLLPSVAAAQAEVLARSAVKKSELREPAPPVASWAPPVLESGAMDEGCPTAQVVRKVGERVQEMMDNLTRYTATEEVSHWQLRKPGHWAKPVQVHFEYLAEVSHDAPGVLTMTELRDGGMAWNRFPAGVATLGIPATVLVFHPSLVGGYTIKCEGKSDWQGHSAWVLYFQQRPDKPPRLCSFVVRDRVWPVRIKGRAWIDTKTYNAIHIETDLMDPVPQIALFRDHMAIDYAPVHFVKEGEDLWLPERAEAYMDFRHHRFRRVHSFSDFLLFNVDVGTKDKAPEGH